MRYWFLIPILLVLPVTAQAGHWPCTGDPPSPGDGVWETAFAFEPLTTANALEVAKRRATGQLKGRLCQPHQDCEALASHIQPWAFGEGNGRACVVAAIERKDYDAWLCTQSNEALRAALATAARELVDRADVGKRRLVFQYGAFEDQGEIGGPRVDALLPHVTVALQGAGAAPVARPGNLHKGRVPLGVDLMVEGVLTPLPNGAAILTLTARKRGARALAQADPVEVPAALVGPPPDDSLGTWPPPRPDLRVYLDERQAGGSMCAGQEFQLWLHSDYRVHVRVIDIYGLDGAILIYPNQRHPDDVVPAGRPIPLGGEALFAAVPTGPSERFLVVAARSPAGLGRLRHFKQTCRLPVDLVHELRAGRGIPEGALVASDGFRVKTRGCPPPPPRSASPEQLLSDLARVPECRMPEEPRR